jgi:ribonuclease P protein component
MIHFKALFSFKKKEVERAFSVAKFKAQINGLKLLYVPAELNINEFGKILIITPRGVGNACKRNRIRRQIKAIFYEEKLYTKPATLVLIVYKSALELSHDTLKDFLIKNLS